MAGVLHCLLNDDVCTGYRLDTGEVDRLLDQLDVGHTGHVDKAQFAASQIDWGVLQQNHAQWLDCVRRAFDEFDSDGDGVCSVDDIIKCLQTKLPLSEVGDCHLMQLLRTCNTASVPCIMSGRLQQMYSAQVSWVELSTLEALSMSIQVAAAVRHVMAEAKKHEESMKNGLSFEQFMVMLRADSRESLDQYDDRLGGSSHGGAGGSGHGGSCRGGAHGLAALLDRSVRNGTALDPVVEVVQ
jgi:calcium-dependent protein kinase